MLRWPKLNFLPVPEDVAVPRQLIEQYDLRPGQKIAGTVRLPVQREKFLSLDKVELAFTPGALQAAAEVALDRKTGARALRSIVEESLLEVMYDIPDRTDIRKCIITEETIRSGRLPLLLTKSDVDKGVDETNYEEWLAERGETA